MTEDMRRRHDDPSGWRAAHEGAEDDWRGAVARMQVEGPRVGWTFGEVIAVVAAWVLLVVVVGGWLLEGLGVGIWELWR